MSTQNQSPPTSLQVAAQLHIKQTQLQNPAQASVSARVTRNLEGFSHSWTLGKPGRKKSAGSLLPGGLTRPAVSTFSSPASIPAGTGCKITGSFLSQHRHGTTSSSSDNRAKEKKKVNRSHCHLKIAPVEIERGGLWGRLGSVIGIPGAG